MAEHSLFNSLLLPTDFSENAWSAFQQALRLVDHDESEIVVMHAIDPAFVDQVVQMGLGDHQTILESLRQNALARLQQYSEVAAESTNIDTLVSEGEPFLEIICKADDFAVDAIVMSKTGTRNQPKTLLFGSTAEKVIRGSKKPVIVLPG